MGLEKRYRCICSISSFGSVHFSTEWYRKLTYKATSAEWRRAQCRQEYDWLSFIELFEMSYSSNWGSSYNSVCFFSVNGSMNFKEISECLWHFSAVFSLNDLEYLGLVCCSCGLTSSTITLMQGVADWNVEANQKKLNLFSVNRDKKSRQQNYLNIKWERSMKKVFKKFIWVRFPDNVVSVLPL